MLSMKRIIAIVITVGVLNVLSAHGAGVDPDLLLDKDALRPAGQWYEATVPDTLDLAERAKLCVNVMLGNVDPEKEYSVYQGFTFGANGCNPHGLTWNIQHKNIRALPKLRTMCGSERGIDLEYEIMRNVLLQIAPDGIIYFPIGGDNVKKGTSHPLINSLAVLAMVNWYQRDRNPEWLKCIHLVCQGLEKMGVKRGDRAFYPLESGYSPDGQWHWTTRGAAITPYTPPEEPVLDYQGIEGAVKFDVAGPMRAFMRDFKFSQSQDSLAMARRITRFILKPSMWMETSGDGYMGHEHGIFNGHFHGNVTPLYSLLDLALADNNDWLKQFVREAYDHARHCGVTRMGFFPAWLMPLKCDRADVHAGRAEGCGISDMLILAVRLSDAGLGDYWDDVDYYVRNQLIEQQFADLDVMKKMIPDNPKDIELLERFVGGFGSAEPTANPASIHGCCSANGAIGLYHAWHGITRFDSGIAKVNMFLNRAAPWMDIDSYLPYEGKVILRNKKARVALIRIPGWVEADRLQCFVNEDSVKPTALGNYRIFEGLKPKDEIRLLFPVAETTDIYTIHRKGYNIMYRASTIVDIQPRDRDSRKYPMYRRHAMKTATEAPMHKVKRFVADRIIPLQ